MANQPNANCDEGPLAAAAAAAAVAAEAAAEAADGAL